MELTPSQWQSIALSLQVSLAAVTISLPAGIALGWLLARRNFYGKTLLDTLVNLPLVMPPVVTGMLLLLAFGQQGWLGSYLERWFGVRLVFDWKGAALASAVVSFPLMVRAIRLAIQAVDVRLEQASRTLGSGTWQTLFRITLPLALPGIVAGVLLAFARSMGEFGATIMIAGNIAGHTQTIPLHIYNLLEVPGGLRESYGLVLVSIAIAAGALWIGDWMERRMKTRHVLS